MCASRSPLPRASRPPLPRGSRSPLSRASRPPIKEKKRILIVDDNAMHSHVAKACLEQTDDYVVKELNEAKTAVAAAEKFKPHLILLDVRMPGIDGCELAASFQANPQLRTVPIVFLTALVTKKEVESGSGWMGKFPMLAKPIVFADLVACVKRHSGD